MGVDDVEGLAFVRIRRRIEAMSMRVHNGAWVKTEVHGADSWKAVGVRVYDITAFSVWAPISRGR